MKDSVLDILYNQYANVCQKPLARYVRKWNNLDEEEKQNNSKLSNTTSTNNNNDIDDEWDEMDGPFPFQYCILEPFMSKKHREWNIESLLSKNENYSSQKDIKTNQKQIENAIIDGEYNFGQLLNFDKRSMSHIQYVREYCGTNNFDEYLFNNCHIKSLAGEACSEIKSEISDCISNFACDRVRDAFVECRSDLKDFDNASFLRLMLETKDIHYGGMKEIQCGSHWKDLQYCIDKYTLLGAVIKPDRRFGNLRYAPLDEESFRRYKQFARKEAKRLREDMEANL